MFILGLIIGLLVGFFVLPLLIRKITTCIIQKRAAAMLKKCCNFDKFSAADSVDFSQMFKK